MQRIIPAVKVNPIKLFQNKAGEITKAESVGVEARILGQSNCDPSASFRNLNSDAYKTNKIDLKTKKNVFQTSG